MVADEFGMPKELIPIIGTIILLVGLLTIWFSIADELLRRLEHQTVQKMGLDKLLRKKRLQKVIRRHSDFSDETDLRTPQLIEELYDCIQDQRYGWRDEVDGILLTIRSSDNSSAIPFLKSLMAVDGIGVMPSLRLTVDYLDRRGALLQPITTVNPSDHLLHSIGATEIMKNAIGEKV